MSGRTWRQDPNRKEHIELAALQVIVEHGVAGTTFRKVAEQAQVPLGATTYYFGSMHELLIAAFTHFSQDVSSNFAAEIRAARNRDQACDAVVNIIFADGTASPRVLLLSYELYAFARRHPEMTAIMEQWMARSRSALELHFSKAAASAIDALIEGMTIHRSVVRMTKKSVRNAVGQLALL
ncbi:TetR/AcrR family transcriptional regulator [Xanthomonas cannabis]|uniref:TetR family transcriptional regulator n=1 Tax=Xanthomonas cannabis pv. phaseoli TaxID=1885902 RepID=A0AB34PA04_9XANT|nr:TetR family transcriptional regulator [Xanthomonas cannabis]KGK58003.1 TetR family transcriptional regulator [Xanthomonas cannabis pv. phaseoli]NIK16936.1 DNA-binding transcriptional regulator YbjK [Xanthomonas cannabis]